MPRGNYPFDYLHNPLIRKPIEDIYRDLDGYTNEFFAENPETAGNVDFFLMMPPIWYDGQFTKGLFFSQGVDYLHEKFPWLPELFHSMAYAMSWNIPWSKKADAYLTCYNNPHREVWFKANNPDRKDKLFLPLEDSDYTNEYLIAPVLTPVKDIDVLMVARLDMVKNLPMMAMALRVYRAKYPQQPIMLTLICGKEFGPNYENLLPHELDEIRKIESILIHPRDYIRFVPQVTHYSLNEYYSRAKVLILTSLVEGKNRAIHEAMSCNTPVICFKEFNQFTRGDDVAFPSGAGMLSEHFDAECLADTIHAALTHPQQFKARKRYLETNGRKVFFNTTLDAFHSQYQNVLPGYSLGKHTQNLWLDLGIQDNYQLSLFDYMYDKNMQISRMQGVENIERLLQFFRSRQQSFKQMGGFKDAP